jgi:hypothetical protein
MKKETFFSRSNFLKALSIFILSFLVYLLYLLAAHPGHYSGDTVAYLDNFLRNKKFDNWTSYFYNIYVIAFYLITSNLAALGLF